MNGFHIDVVFMRKGYLLMAHINLQITKDYFQLENEVSMQLYSIGQGVLNMGNKLLDKSKEEMKTHPLQRKISSIPFEKKVDLMRLTFTHDN